MEKLEMLLTQRTVSFASVPRTEDEIFAFKRKNNGPHRLSRPFPGFHHCPFLGLIGGLKKRVGCLLHPSVPGNNGVDYRSLSWYGEQACRNYFCPSTHKISSVFKLILIQSIDNWYTFGLIVTEYALLTAYFKEIESRLGRQVVVSDYVNNIKAANALNEFAKLKANWPYRRDDCPGPCNFFFENGLYSRPDFFHTPPGGWPTSYKEIFRELDSEFSSEKDLVEGCRLLDNLFVKTQRAIES
ncbi:hypothetical protein [Desulforhopalus sp. IMCC35007]|uniref:hypothetical protein n=1 Tax=Desulforhopalus sp. IMCC35007 TaxID=2569543 RepID=UPI0010ADFB85|nr:hypothetical protein [Desulforhopalus sp. IMCC35007]TKB10041.1 hypothetical protein FCL48_08725 [Desulforhopalus sp. IMCC35007]